MQNDNKCFQTQTSTKFAHSLEETRIQIQSHTKQDSVSQISVPKKTEAKIIQIEGEAYSRTLAKNYLFSYVINKIQRNDCFEHSYLLFYIPALLVISRHLSLIKNQKSTGSFKLLIFFIRRIQWISKQKEKQMDQAQLMKYVTIALKYRDAELVKNTLKEYMEKHYEKMMGFMPVYGLYFKLLTHVDQLLQQNAEISHAIALINKTELQFKKYNNQQI